MKYRVRVETYSGSKEFEVDYLWFWNGKILRAICHDEFGVSYKFKDDEEPIELIES